MPSTYKTTDNENFDTAGATPTQVNQIVWQGLPGVYLAATNNGLMKTVDGGLTWDYLRPNATFGETWPAGAIGRQVSFGVGPRVCPDEPIWEEILIWDEFNMPTGPEVITHWIGISDSVPDPPSLAPDVEFTSLGLFYTSNYTEVELFLMRFTSETPFSPFTVGTLFKCSEELDKVNIDFNIEKDTVGRSFPAVPAGGPIGPHYNGPYTLLSNVSIAAVSEKDALMGMADVRSGSDIFAEATGSFVKWNALVANDVPLPDDYGWADGFTHQGFLQNASVIAQIGPIIDPAQLSYNFTRYWDEAGQPTTKATVFGNVLKISLSPKVAGQT